MRVNIFPIALLLLFPSVVYASDPTPLLYFLATQILQFAWPLVLPLFFLRGSQKKLKIYLAYLIVTYGIAGIVSVPVSFYYQFAAWLSWPLDNSWVYFVSIGQGIFSLVLSIVSLIKFGAPIREKFDA